MSQGSCAEADTYVMEMTSPKKSEKPEVLMIVQVGEEEPEDEEAVDEIINTDEMLERQLEIITKKNKEI